MEKKTELLTFKTTHGAEVILPLATVIGAEPGPTTVITAGIHGCEYAGIAAAIQLFKTLDPATLCGTVKIVTISSVVSFEARRMFVCPIDEKNPNRFFPGNPTGSYTDQYVYFLMENIISKGDYYIDLHGGDMAEALEAFSIYHAGDDAVSQKSYELARYCGLPNIVATRADGAWSDSGTTYANAAKLGIPSIIAEAGSIGQLEERDTQSLLDGLINVLKYTGNLEGAPLEPDTLRTYSTITWLYAGERKGIFYKTVTPGMTLKAGDPVGVLEDYFGNVLERPVSPADGRVLFVTTSPAMAEKGQILGIAIE